MTTHELYQLEDDYVIVGKGIGLNDKTIQVTEAVVFRSALKDNNAVVLSRRAYEKVLKEKTIELLEYVIKKDKVLFTYPFNIGEKK